MNRCKPEIMDTRDYGKSLKRVVILEEARVPASNARDFDLHG